VAQAMRASHSSSSLGSASGLRRASNAAAHQPGIENSSLVLMRDGSVMGASAWHQFMDDAAETLYLIPVLRVARETAATLKALSREVYVPMAVAGLVSLPWHRLMRATCAETA
jgi:hypothetical protein